MKCYEEFMKNLSHLRPTPTALRFRGLCSGAESGWDFTTRWMDDSHMADLVGWQGQLYTVRQTLHWKTSQHEGNML